MKLYVDSNIFLNYFLDEFGPIETFSSFRAEEFFTKASEGNIQIIVSNLVISEITDVSSLDEKDVKKFLLTIHAKLENVTPNDVNKAKEVSKKYGLHLRDAIHTVMALQTGCDAVVTRNLKDFNKVSDLIKALKPEELNI
ncbi:MAG: type II toxin-antitoxin system VapC family toxin [Candidatus Nanoarchaeia archaeon]|nr:type II toxin-antitoxin system VapC family toxin [Candidatus Nanoarchaeia archaeon]MDD5238970.1 type II toxin-antitoxin system VapC family toxin [Candidatus Nanoarchaeia archaeon]